MLADLYVIEKLRELSADVPRVQGGRSAVPFAMPVMRLVGRLLCRIGERLQWEGSSFDAGLCDPRVGEPTLRPRRTD
jgi:hypothetical protein